MDAIVIEIADAVTASLNGATLSQAFTAERLYVPVFELSDAEIHVPVVPISLESELLDRSARSIYDYVVDVGVLKRVTKGPLSGSELKALVDPLMFLAQEIGDRFNGKSLAPAVKATCVKVANRPIFDQKALDQKKLFMTSISLTFRLGR